MADKRTGWLAELKVGDEVCYYLRWGRDVRITRILAITPSGRIRTKGYNNTVVEFSHNGRNRDGIDGTSLHEVTDEVREQNHRQVVLARLEEWVNRRAWSTIPTEKLDALWVFVKDWSGG